MKYTAQTGDMVLDKPQNTTSATVPGEANIRFISPKLVVSNFKAICVEPKNLNEELSKEDEEKFYQKVMKTSLL